MLILKYFFLFEQLHFIFSSSQFVIEILFCLKCLPFTSVTKKGILMTSRFFKCRSCKNRLPILEQELGGVSTQICELWPLLFNKCHKPWR
jgi:hypothetical protein